MGPDEKRLEDLEAEALGVRKDESDAYLDLGTALATIERLEGALRGLLAVVESPASVGIARAVAAAHAALGETQPWELPDPTLGERPKEEA